MAGSDIHGLRRSGDPVGLAFSKYLLELPSKEEMQAFLERSLKQELL